jgi:DUF1680 family protein
MDRRKFLISGAALPLVAGIGPGRTEAEFARESTSSPAEPVALQGPQHQRYELTLNRVLHGTSPAFTPEFLLADVRPTPGRRFTEYSGDLSGRYVGALATAGRVYKTNFPDLDSLVDKIIALQKPDGYFGSNFHYDKPTDLDLALLWGNGRLLVGLLEYYRYKPWHPVLESSKRLGDFLLRIAPLMLSNEIRQEFGASHFASSYICWTQQTEGLANLFIETKDARYKDLTEKIAAVIERRPGDHVHGYLTSLRGVMDLYQATNDSRLLEQCETAWQDIVQSEDLLITGGVPEGWSPNKHRTEGCAEAEWLRLNLALWHATSNAKYLAMAERTTFNEFSLNQFSTGDFGHRVLTETGISGDGAARAWWCCTLHGLRCFPDIHEATFRAKEGDLRYDLPLDGAISLDPVDNATSSAGASSSLANEGTVQIKFAGAPAGSASLRIRKPEWADSIEINVNGATVPAAIESGYASLRRQWEKGDTVTVHYGMSLRTLPEEKKRSAYMFGPWLLGAAQASDPAYFNELTIENRLAKSSSPAASNSPAHSFAVPIAATSFPYTAAEFPEQHQAVTLRAVAEQTGEPTTTWQLRFLSEPA